MLYPHPPGLVRENPNGQTVVPFQLREERLCICARAFLSDSVDYQLSLSATGN